MQLKQMSTMVHYLKYNGKEYERDIVKIKFDKPVMAINFKGLKTKWLGLKIHNYEIPWLLTY